MPIQALLSSTEWRILNEQVEHVSKKYSDILGVLAVGSFVQTFRPAPDYYSQRRNGALGHTYEAFRGTERRKVFPSENSDLDIWICLRDTEESTAARRIVELGGMALLEELAQGTILKGTAQWYSKKQTAFHDHYKNSKLYPTAFSYQNGPEPWLANRFKEELEDAIAYHLPEFRSNVNNFTNKQIPGDFLEVRAYPESLFHLRPDQNIMEDGIEDRAPFPRIADDQWLNPNYESFIMYNTEEISIYPFKPNGEILGSAIDEHIYEGELPTGQKSYGGILLKPDAVERGQVSLIMDKIKNRIAAFNGKIILEQEYTNITENDVASIYPLLRGQDLIDATVYLTSGSVIGIIIESSLPQDEMLRAINAIKGPRMGDRSESRLIEGRIIDGGIRDLPPLPGDEQKYLELLKDIRARNKNPAHRFTDTQYQYYSRNLAHTPDNTVELKGLLSFMNFIRPR